MNNQENSLCVVLANYNQENYLPRSLGEILKQLRPQDRLIIVDDASTDGSLEVIQRICGKDPRLTLITHKENAGANQAFMEGAQRSQEKWLYLAGTDDWILPGFFHKSLFLLGCYPQASFCTTDYTIEFESTQRRAHGQSGPPTGEEYLSPSQFRKFLDPQHPVSFSGTTTIYNREDFLHMGGFHPEFRWYSDVILGILLAQTKGYCKINESLAVFNSRDASYSCAGTKRRKQNRGILKNYIRFVTSPQLSGQILSLLHPACLGIYKNSKIDFLFYILFHPSKWKFLRPIHFKTVMRDCTSFKKFLWDILWLFAMPMGSKSFLKKFLLRLFGCKFKGKPQIAPFVHIDYPWNLDLGENVILGPHVIFSAKNGKISLGKNVIIETNACLLTSCWDQQDGFQTLRTGDITIENNVLVGAKTTLMPGSKIKENSYLSTGCVIYPNS